MEPHNEAIKPFENKATLNSDLSNLLNEGLNVAIGEFTKNNKGKLDSKTSEFRGFLDIIEAAVAESNPDGNPDSYQIREKYLDKRSDCFYIKLAKKNQINYKRTTVRGWPALDLSSMAPVYECQIAIKSFNPNGPSANTINAQAMLERRGYSVNLSVNQFVLENGKLEVAPMVGVNFRLSLVGETTASLQTYIGKEGFEQINKSTLSKFNSDKVIQYLDSLGISSPRQY